MAAVALTAGDKNRGPWWHRFFVRVLTLVLLGLVYMTIGFLVDDIWSSSGPNFGPIEAKYVDRGLREREATLHTRQQQLQRRQRDKTTHQNELRAQTANSQTTWNQLLQFRKLAIDKGTALSPAEQKALDEAQQLFLDNQKAEMVLQKELADLTRETHTLQDELQDVTRAIDKQLQLAHAEFSQLERRHRWWLGVRQITLLIPLLLAAGYLFVRLRGTMWTPFAYAVGGAAFLKVLVLLHGFFPIESLIYPLVGTALAIVGGLLGMLIRTRAKPQTEWLLKQYRDAYESFLCPVCEYPIRRGPLKYLFWNRKTLPSLQIPKSDVASVDDPYTCPCCGTALYEECTACHHTRHALLPACESCGHAKDLHPAT